MSNRQIKGFYENYPKYWEIYSKEYIKKIGKCQFCGTKGTKKNILTCAHLDQNPKNNHPKNIRVLCRYCHIKYDQPFHVFSMQTNRKKTDNSHLKEKVELRLDCLKLINKSNINILEAFSGNGIIWNEVKKQTNKHLNILMIEKKNDKKGVYLQGDNKKFMPLFNYENYDIIDIDAYGIPYHHLETIFRSNFNGFVCVTAIQSVMGRLPNKLLEKLGYTKNMINKIPTLFGRHGMNKLYNYLSMNKIEEIKGFFIDRKNYFYFRKEHNENNL